MATADFHLAVALDGTGWHPASWREADARPRDLLTAGYWANLVTEAEGGLLDGWLVAEGDEVLDWREMAAWCAAAQLHVLPGGDHALSDFPDHLPEIEKFLGLAD